MNIQSNNSTGTVTRGNGAVASGGNGPNHDPVTSEHTLQQPITTVITARPVFLHTVTHRSSQEFICGWSAAIVNILLTFPVSKLQFRQTLHGIGLKSAVRQLKVEGFSRLYRGLLPPLIHKSSTLCVMFGMYDYYRYKLYTQAPRFPLHIQNTCAALLAGSTEVVLMPLERVQTLLQDRQYNYRLRNTLDAFHTVSRYGSREYYRGMSAILLRNGPSCALFFNLRLPLKNMLPTSTHDLHGFLNDFVSGAILGAGLSALFYPINVVKTRMQAQLGGEFTSCWATLHKIYHERNCSVRAVYYGLGVNVSRALFGWGITNVSYEIVKQFLFGKIT